MNALAIACIVVGGYLALLMLTAMFVSWLDK